MTEVVDIGKISSRGQVAIPREVREKMGLNEGDKVLFYLEDDTLLVKKVGKKTFAEITKPLKELVKKSGLTESDVNRIVHRTRK